MVPHNNVMRGRNIIQQAEGDGKSCDGPDSVLNETAGCKSLAPCADEKTPVDCEYGDWSDWGAPSCSMRPVEDRLLHR